MDDLEIRPGGAHDGIHPGGHDRRSRIGRPHGQRALRVGKDGATGHERECRGAPSGGVPRGPWLS